MIITTQNYHYEIHGKIFKFYVNINGNLSQFFFFQKDHIKLSIQISISMHSDDIHNILTFRNISISNCYTSNFSYDAHL